MKFLSFFLTFLLLSFLVVEASFRQGELYEISGGSLSTDSGETIRAGQRVQVTGQDGWSYSYRLVDRNMQPTGPEYRSSKYWMERSARPVGINHLVESLVQEALSDGALQVGEIEPHCPGCEAERSLAPEVSLRPRSSPFRSTGSVDAGPSKTVGQAEAYFRCYQNNEGLMRDFTQRYRRSIQSASRALITEGESDLSAEEIEVLMSCLIFRESSHWVGRTSPSGAVGLGQFTGEAIDQVKTILNYSGRDNYDERIAIQRSEHEAGRLSQSELNSNIRMIESERRRYQRMTELQAIWNSIPMDSRPRANQITRNYLADNDNHQAVIALSTLLLRECQINLRDSSYEMTEQETLLACAGAYNMGLGGFSSNALSANGPHNVETWARNLSNSGARQAGETRNHVISIHRCVSGNENFPPCGTDAHYCQDLPRTNVCQQAGALRCSGECQ